jgi:hypothetical protein
MPLKSDRTTWTDPRHLRGLHGEQVAMRYLTFAGWRVTDHRFRMGRSAWAAWRSTWWPAGTAW